MSKKILKLCFPVLIIICFISNIIVFNSTTHQGPLFNDTKIDYINFSDDWYYSSSEDPTPVLVDLPYLRDLSMKKNSTYKITKQMSAIDIKNPAIVMTVFQKPFIVSINNTEIFEYDPNTDGFIEGVGSGRFLINLNSIKVNDIITIEFINRVPQEDSRIQAINIIDSNLNSQSSSLQAKEGSTLTFITFLFGVLFTLISIIPSNKVTSRKTIFTLGLFAMTAAIWLLCNTKLIQTFTTNFLFIHKLEMLSFFLCPVLLWIVIYERWLALRKLVAPAIIITGIFYLFALFNDLFNLMDVGQLLIFFNQLGYVNIAYFLFISFYAFIKKVDTYEMFVVMIAVFTSLTFIDLTLHLSYNNGNSVSIYIVFAILLFVCTMFISYLKKANNDAYYLARQDELEYLKRLNYLTLLPNGLKLVENSNKYKPEQIILSFSLIDLEHFRVTKGLSEVNNQIIDFAKDLNIAFGKNDIYHIFDNQFIVILNFSDSALAEFEIDRFRANRQLDSNKVALNFNVNQSQFKNFKF